jgi:hypothetical protein
LKKGFAHIQMLDLGFCELGFGWLMYLFILFQTFFNPFDPTCGLQGQKSYGHWPSQGMLFFLNLISQNVFSQSCLEGNRTMVTKVSGLDENKRGKIYAAYRNLYWFVYHRPVRPRAPIKFNRINRWSQTTLSRLGRSPHSYQHSDKKNWQRMRLDTELCGFLKIRYSLPMAISPITAFCDALIIMCKCIFFLQYIFDWGKSWYFLAGWDFEILAEQFSNVL